MLTLSSMTDTRETAPQAENHVQPSPLDDAAVLRAAKDAAVTKAGGAAALALRLGITPKAIYQWPYVPAERVGSVSALTGIPAHELRPDVFPAPLESRDPVGTSVGE